MGCLMGRLGAGQRDNATHEGSVSRGLPGGGCRRARGVDPGQGEPPLPAPDRRPADPDALGDLRDGQLIGRMQNDPSTLRVFKGAVAISDNRLETSAIVGRDQGQTI